MIIIVRLRLQLPVKLCYSMATNKALRQTLNVAGLGLTVQ